MLDTLKIIAAELVASAIQPRIEKAKTDLKLCIVTATVVVVFALLALVCLYVVVFLHLSETMLPETAALYLFGFSIFMCLGALAMYAIGRAVEQRLYERRIEAPFRTVGRHIPDRDDIDIAGYVQHIFADNKATALIASAVMGIVLGAKPGMVFRSLGKIVAGGGKHTGRTRRRPRRER